MSSRQCVISKGRVLWTGDVPYCQRKENTSLNLKYLPESDSPFETAKANPIQISSISAATQQPLGEAYMAAPPP